MAIDRIPGVGPTNADIATAAAPSAATIASTIATTPAVSSQITASVPTAAAIATAVAAPSLASITTAITNNAAPASVTMAAITSSITTNAASAGVTLAAIGTQVANNAPSPNAFTVISSVTWNNTSVLHTFTGLSGYKRYRLLVGYTPGAAGPWSLRLNGDGANNYDWIRNQNTGTNAMGTGVGVDTILLPGPSGGSTVGGIYTVDIDFATLACHKFISTSSGYGSVAGTPTGYITNGIYRSTSTVSSITIFGTTNNFASGTIYLLGAN